MKKIIALILTLALSVVLFGCGTKSVTEELVGSWGNDDGDIVTFYEDGTAACASGSICGIIPSNWAYADGKLGLQNALLSRSKDITVNGDEFILGDSEIWHRLED